MSRFAPALREISDRLSLPQPARARVLMEIAGDLDDLFHELLERGQSEEEAARAALARIDLSDEALRGLARVHGGWFRRLSDSVAERAGSRWEPALLGLLVLGGVGLSGTVLHAVPMARSAGYWLAPVLCAAVGTLGIGAWKSWVILLRRDHRPKQLRAGLRGMLGLTLAQLFLAFAGVWASALMTSGAIGAEPIRAGAMTLNWLQAALALLVLGMSLALLGGLVWFFLLGKVVSIERDEVAALVSS